MANDKDFIVKNAVEVGGSVKTTVGTLTSGSEGYYLSGASYDGAIFSVSSQSTQPGDVVFSSDGTKMYIINQAGASASVEQYNLTTAYDISTASHSSADSLTVGTEDTSPFGITFKPDGTKLYVTGSTGDSVYQYTLTTGYDLSTASYDSTSFSYTSQDTATTGTLFNSDGTKLYMLGAGTDAIYQYSLSTAYDVSTASYDSVSLSVSSQFTAPYGFRMNSDGTKFFVAGNGDIAVYTLSTAYDLSTASYTSTFDVNEDTLPYGLDFNSDGTKMFVVGVTGDFVYQYATALSTQTLDLSTGNYLNHTLTEDTKFLLSNAGDVQSFQLEVTGTPATSGDILFFAADAGNSSNYGAATGWTNIVDIANQGGIGVDSNFYLARQTVASDGTYSISFSTANANAAPSGGAFLYNGGTYQGISRGASTVSFASGLTVGESVLFLIESNEDSEETYTPPTGYTLLFENISSETTATATVASYKIADATSESTDGGTFSGTSDVYRALIHVRNSGVTASASDIFSDAQPFTSLTSNYSADGDVTPGTITWPDTIEWPDGTAPLSPSGGEKDLYTFTTDDSGTTYKGVLSAYNLS